MLELCGECWSGISHGCSGVKSFITIPLQYHVRGGAEPR